VSYSTIYRTDSTDVLALREQLWDAGFRPVPVYNWDDEALPERDRGKRPMGEDWRELALKDPPAAVEYPPHERALNTGILCDGLRAIDVDIDASTIAARVRSIAVATLGEGPIRMRGQSARHLILYRAAEGQPRKRVLKGTYGKIEVLGAGQQFAAFGRHQTGADLTWTEPPGACCVDTLPAVTEAQITAFLTACAPVINAEPPKAASEASEAGATSAAGQQAEFLRVAEALAAIPNDGPPDWEYWNKIGLAVWAATGGSAGGAEAFAAWSARHPAYNQQATANRWRHYATSPPTQIGAGTLFHLAQEARQKREPPSEDEATREETPPKEDEDDLLKGIWDAGQDDYVIQPRGWLLGKVFCRRFLSSLIADGGVGKTALRIAQLLSLAIGRSLTGEYVHRRCRVLFLSLEDDKDELRRRVYAALRHYSIDPAYLKGWLYLDAPKGLKLAVMNGRGIPEVGVLERYLRKAITTLKLDVVALDPFVKTHGLAENDNNAMDLVCDRLATIAIDLDCAIDSPHHTSKGPATAGDANRGRGASSIKDAGRLVYTLTPMTPEEGQLFDLSEAERRSLVRMDSGKVNIAPPSTEATWFRLIGQPLDNGTADYPHGDEVQTVEPWEPPATWAGLDPALLNRILDDIDAGMANGQRYSAAGPATARAAWRVVQKHAPDKSEKACRAVINAWLKSGTLFSESYDDPVESKERTGLRVNATLRPS
jgi:hypothetical protein